MMLWNIQFGQTYAIDSPDQEIKLKVEVGNIITYNIHLNEQLIISPSAVGLELEDKLLGSEARVKNVNRTFISEDLHPVVPRKNSVVRNEYNEIGISFNKKFKLTFRVYDDGVAYRWETGFKDSIQVVSEQAGFNFDKDYRIWFPEEESMFSHQERVYKHIHLSEITDSMFCSTGTLVELDNGVKAFISESDLLDYPGMFLTGTKEKPYGLKGKFAGYPLETELKNDRSEPVTRHAPYLSRTSGSRTFPWRVIIITKEDAQLVESDMVWKLATPSRLEETSWIKPGKVAWDWWNDLNIYNVDFEAGINTNTYKYYIDFAHNYDLDYIILDEGWYHLEDVLKIKEEIDLEEIIRYGNSKDVGIILWVTWKALYDQLDTALEKFEQWGARGIKVDFMQRDDQWMVNYYTEVARKAAAHHLLVDYHGAYKPTGLHRTYPNVLTFEGVAGLEQNKWGEKANPEHDLVLPFIRMVAGPMDYTPGAMINASKKNFRPVWSSPMSQGTRCHQLAMYVVFESPLQMLSDNPTNYIREADAMAFLSRVPVTWDETKVLEAKVSDYIILARRKGNTWYLGGMTDWETRKFTLDFSFLGEGEYLMEIWDDGLNANRQAADYRLEIFSIDSTAKRNINMAEGGGFAAIITPIK
jgi:alpha-glucosidase